MKLKRSLQAVTNSDVRDRLKHAPGMNVIPRTGFRASRMLAERNLLIQSQTVGVKFISFATLSMTGEDILLGMNSPTALLETIVPSEDKVVTTQEFLRLDALRYYVEYPHGSFGLGCSEPQLYRMKDGTLVVLDGNHRVAAAVLTGSPIEVAVTTG